MFTKIHHIGIAVQDLQHSLTIYRDLLGLELAETHEVAEQKVRTALFPLGDTQIELIQPTAGNVGVTKFLATRGEGVHHLCFEVADLELALQTLKDRGAVLIDESPRLLDGGKKKMAFVHPKSTGGVLIELYQLCEER